MLPFCGKSTNEPPTHLDYETPNILHTKYNPVCAIKGNNGGTYTEIEYNFTTNDGTLVKLAYS